MALLPPLPAPLAITVLVRALDTGAHVERVWRSSRRIGPVGLLLAVDLPFEPGRPVQVGFELPDDPVPLSLTAEVCEVRVEGDVPDADTDPDRPRPRGVRFVGLDDDTRVRIDRYVRERMLLS